MAELAEARKDAQLLLDRRGITLEELAGSVAVSETGTLLLVGSVADGLASDKSDIDLLLLGEGEVDAETVFLESGFESSLERRADGWAINVDVWRSHQLAAVEERFGNAPMTLEDPSDLKNINILSIGELLLLHRLRTGVVLKNPGIAEGWRRRLGVEYLADYRVLTGILNHHTYREDLLGELGGGHAQSALWILRSALECLASAVLASVGETNPRLKWLVRLLARHREAVGTETADALRGWLVQADESGDPEGTVRRALAFADRTLEEVLGRVPELQPLVAELQDRLGVAAG